MANKKPAKPKQAASTLAPSASASKPAKLATSAKVVAVHLTKRLCDHCGEPIPANQVLAVQRTVMGARGKGGTRMIFFIKGHENLPKETN